MKFRLSIGLLLCALLLLPKTAQAQMPPHPRLVERIEKGLTPMPSVLRNVKALRARGIDAPWSSPEAQATIQSSRPDAYARTFGPAIPPVGTYRALAILVKFSDQPSQVSPGFFDTLLFVQRPGSLRDYYKAVSYNTLDIVTVNMPSSVGWLMAPRSYAYYVNNANGMGAYPQNSQKLVEDIVAAADPYVDFSNYDNDGDGYVDALFIIHTGAGAEFTSLTTDIWSHAWSTWSVPQVDGVSVLRYSIEPEYWQSPRDMTIGVYAHELGHAAFGLPDFYDRDYSSQGLGRWSLMAGGSWNGPYPGGGSPAFPDAWCRIQMGFVIPTVVMASVIGQSCPAAETTPEVFRLWEDGSVGPEYFLVENRQQIGYDSYLPGEGLLVYHIDESVGGQNDREWFPGQEEPNGSHYYAALEQADGLYQLEKGVSSGDDGDPFPGVTGNITFTLASKPASMSYGFGVSGVGIRNISPSAPVMIADFIIDSDEAGLALVTPYGGELWKGGSSQQISWAAVNVNGDVVLDYSTDGGATWKLIDTVSANLQHSSLSTLSLDAETQVDLIAAPPSVQSLASYSWTVPQAASSLCLVRVSGVADPALRDWSQRSFTITPSAGLWSIQFNFDASQVTGDGGNAGAVFIPTLNEFWTSRWGSNKLHRWRLNGSLVGEFTVTGVGNVRGMTFDGTNVYAATGTTTIQIINPVTRQSAGTLSSPVNARYVTYDRAADNGNGGFWVGDFSINPTLISRMGAILRSLNYGLLGSTGNYGAAYDNLSPGGPYLWFWGQGAGGGSPQVLVQVNVESGLPTGVTHDVASDIGAGSNMALAGGLFFTTGIVGGKATLGGILQGSPNRLFGYEVADAPLPIQLANFTGALLSDGAVELHWVTLSETDNLGFEVQKCIDSAGQFQTIENSFIEGRGTTTDTNRYTFVDRSPGVWFSYRLKQIDRSGGVHYSEAIVPTAILGIEEKFVVPQGFALEQNYPNPFNPRTAVRSQMSEARHVRLAVYDLLGREVAVLFDGWRAAGSYQDTFSARGGSASGGDGTGLASGMYLYRLTAGDFVATRKMVLTK